MILVDYILMVIVLLVAIIGSCLGFGRVLKWITDGIIGFMISIVQCYFLFGLVINFQFIGNFMTLITNGLESASNPFCNFLLMIRIEMIVVAVILFVIVTIIRKLITKIIANVTETDHIAFKIINKSLGAVMGIVIVAVVGLITLQIISVIKDSSSLSFLEGSFFQLDQIYANNPLLLIISKFIRG